MVNHAIPRRNAELYFKTYENADVKDMDKAPAGTVTVTNGKETFQIQPSDLEDAKKDGYNVMER